MTMETTPGWLQAGRLRPRAVVLGPGDRQRVRQTAQELRPIIEKHAELVSFDLQFPADLSGHDADLIVVLGGDGSILRAAHALHRRPAPVLGVNLGKLGFLAAHSPAEFVEVFPVVCRGECSIVHHLMLQCTVFRDGAAAFRRLGLNEAAILGGSPFSILDVDLYVDAQLATTYSCDGLIISTPIGSTAHSLSAGGPILRKDLQAFVISAISPHTLTVRPVVDSADRIFEMVVPQPNEQTAIVVDGEVLTRLSPADRVRVERANTSFPMIELPAHNYYRTLREKLGWGGNLPPTR